MSENSVANYSSNNFRTSPTVQPICPRFPLRHRRTDRHTDGRWIYDSNTALAIRASRGKRETSYVCPHLCQLLTDFRNYFTAHFGEICNKAIINCPTTLQTCCYTTVWKYRYSKLASNSNAVSATANHARTH